MKTIRAIARDRCGDLVTQRIYFIGRSRSNDIRLADPSISRRHAELVVTEDRRYYLTDCTSTHGTHVKRDSHWEPVRQVFVDENDQLRFGQYRTNVGCLLATVRRSADWEQRHAKQEVGHGKPVSGPVVRNPQTGEVQKASD